MKRMRLVQALLCAFGVASVAGWSSLAAAKPKKDPPEKKIEIKACAKKKPPVMFDHPAHVKAMKKNNQECVVCHHLVEKKEPEKQSCTACHLKKQGDLGTCQDKSKKANPFHVQCIGCHMKMGGEAKKATKCNSCHAKK